MIAVASRSANWLFALTVLGGTGLVISFLSGILTDTTRWVLIVALLVVLGTRRHVYRWLTSGAGMWIVANLVWLVCTWFWSEQPQLTLMKGFAFWLVVLSLVGGGWHWYTHTGKSAALSFLLPLAIVALIAGLAGQDKVASYTPGAGMDLYRGLAGNPNMFGSLMFMISPLLLWKLYSNRNHAGQREFWAVLVVLAMAFLLMSVSRAAILGALFVLTGFVVALGLKARISAVLMVSLAGLMLLVAAPGTMEHLEGKYVRKNLRQAEADIFYTREAPWRVSWEMAKKGGWFGAGYGVSIGGGRFEGGLTSVGYGREKGNSQLAIVEETGVVGLVLYIGFLGSLFSALWRAFQVARTRDVRLQVGLVFGALLGATAQGVFEAWWVAPGAPESIWFWALVGVAFALMEVARAQAVPKLAAEANGS